MLPRSRKNSDEVHLMMGAVEPATSPTASTASTDLPTTNAPTSASSVTATAASTSSASNSGTGVSSSVRNRMSRDFVVIKIVARIVLQLVRKFWAFSSAAVLSIVLFYWLCGGLLAFCFMVFACTGLLYHAGDKLLYHPDQPNNARIYVPSPSLVGMAFESLHIRSKDHTRLHCFFIKAAAAATSQQQPSQPLHPTVLFFHGNAGNIGHRILCIKDLVQKLGCNVCLLEYRGYGHSDGTPSEEGLYLDAQAALDHLLGRPDVDPSKVVVFGRSLGGAVAIDLCSRAENRDKVAALLVENSFTCIPDIARVLFNIRPIRLIPAWFYKNKFNSSWKVRRISGTPTLFLSGMNDNLVPSGMMTELFNACGSHSKHLAKFPGGTHNETWNCRHYIATISYFFDEIIQLNGLPKENLHPPPTLVSSSHSVV